MNQYTSFEEFPSDIVEALKRAKAWWQDDSIAGIRYIKSLNTKEPLTDKEKRRIQSFLVLRCFPMDIVFID